ncbi:MAG TPA: M56 family metallopeptidase [Caulobacteraceae bacterium]|nr:M56 family metallopeptidase [Caulobacteraceae bacterium]
MTASAWILALAATLVSGGVGLAAAVIVAGLTKAPRLRYVACTTALVFALAPILMGFGFAADPQTPVLAPLHLAGSAVISWARSAEAPRSSWMLARIAPTLLVAYVIGAAACIGRLGWRWLELRRVLREARAVAPERLKGATSALPVRTTDRVPSALLIGLRHPVAVLPARALEQMTAAQLHWVLAHEEAHARRGDNLCLLAEELLRAVLWFNPFVTWAAILAAEARELLCDQSVLGAADASERRAYGETLLLAVRLGLRPQLASTLIPNGKRRLSMRLEAVMTPTQPTAARAAASFGATAAAGLLTLAVGAATWAQTPAAAERSAPALSPSVAAPSTRGLTMRVVDERGVVKQPVIAGDMVIEARAVVGEQGEQVVRFTLTPEGARRLAALTRANIGGRLAVVVNGAVMSAYVIRGEISGGAGEISGHFTPAEATRVATLINQGRASE